MGRKILLADDSITIQKVVNLTFSDEGIDVITVGNGELAVRKLNEVRPDIVLADVYMPGKSGYEVCEYVKTNPQFAHIPVLLLVGAFEPFDPAEATRVKADGHLTKPFESRALVATVSRLLSAAPPPPIAFSAPPVAAPVPQSWPSIPPDATTTKLSPELAEKFQANFSNDYKKTEPFRASPVIPMQASPVVPIQASPVTPIQASPVFFEEPPLSINKPAQETFSPPPLPNQSSPVSNYVNKVFSFDNNNFDSPQESSLEIESDKQEIEIDRGPVFDLDAPPVPEPSFELDLNDISYNTSEQKVQEAVFNESPAATSLVEEKGFDLNGPNFELNQDPQNQESSQVEEMNLEVQDDPYEATQIMGSASRRELQAAYVAYSQTPSEPEQSVSSDYQEQEISSEVHYDDFTPLDLEPLDDLSYSSGGPPNVPTEELPSISDEFVLESKTSEIKREPLLDLDENPVSSTLAYQAENVQVPLPTMAYPPISIPSYSEPTDNSGDILSTARITGSHGSPRVTEAMPQLPEPESFSLQTDVGSDDVLDLDDDMSAPQPVFQPKLPAQPVSNSVGNTFDLEPSTSHLDIEDPPSQLELEQSPQYYLDNEASYSDEPLADLVTTPELETQPSYASTNYQANYQVEQQADYQANYQANYQAEQQADYQVEQQPEIEVGHHTEFQSQYQSSNVFDEPSISASAPIISGTLAMGATYFDSHRETVESIPVVPPFAPPVAEVPSQQSVLRNIRTADLPTLPSMPVLEAPPTLEVPALSPPVVMAAPVAITSVEQIPQHLVDEIVRRVIAQLSENVVREIAWEVVPDLAQIMIKKHLSQTSGK